MLALSPRAWKRAESLTPGCFYFNLPKEKAKVTQGQTLFTSAVNLVVGLDESLAIMKTLDEIRAQFGLTYPTE